MSRYDIAVIGMGGIFPGANNVEQYWKNIANGESFFKKMPKRLWHMDNFHSESRNVPEKTYTTTGAFIEDFEFPFLEYKLPPNTMRGVDPAQLVTLQATREALNDAGIESRSEDLVDAVTIIGSSGVDQFAHATTFLRRHTYLKKFLPMLEAKGVSKKALKSLEKEMAEELVAHGHTWNHAIAAVGAITSSVSNRVAQVFGVKGFNMTVDAACASSFVAMDTACQALMAGDARLAIAGGCDLGTNPAIYVGFARVEGLSISGNSNPFDHTADGLIIGEGAGIVILKRLEDALKDGDRVRAVIRAVGSTSDGAGQAIYAPSVEGRAEALRKALRNAETSPDEIQFVEAHATSTIVGDANEYDAISKVYAPGRDTNDPLCLGSVKGQIGHLKAAAGVAGFVKTVLAMENGTIPHMPRFTKLTPRAECPSDALMIPSKPKPWPTRSNGKRIAAVTSSGFGGVNYHFIIEQGDSYEPPKPRPEVSREMAIVGVSCRVSGADNPDKFWNNVTSGFDAFEKVDAVELGWEDHLDTGPVNERITTRVVSRVDDYKPNLLRYKIFPNAVSQIAPTQLLGVDLADQLLTNAGFELAEPKKIGVSVGAMHDDSFPDFFMPMLPGEYADCIRSCSTAKEIEAGVLEECIAKVGEEIVSENPPVTEHTLPGWMTNVIAGRIANKLNLQGPNFTVDSACSSGLAALMPAVYQLMFGNVDMMISGGLNQQLSDTFTCGVCALGAVAEEVTKPFDAEGKGFLIGEGGLFYLLKRLEDAKQDGDDIIAVLHSVNGSSEADSKSMVAPTEDAVRRSIRNALDRTDVNPEEIGVVDTHGSANQLSDLVEARAVAAELRKDGGEGPVQITAIKSHIGHIYGGSGATSLFSTIQSLRTETVPGIRNLTVPRPEIEELSDKVQPRFGTEKLPSYVKAGGVNSLGLGGANYFAVVSAPKADESSKKINKSAVRTQDAKADQPFVRADDQGVSDVFICVTEKEEDIASALGRAVQQSPIPQFISEGNTAEAKLAVTFEDQKELKNKLTSALKMLQGGHNLKPLESQGIFEALSTPSGNPEKIAFCFPGQGTHYITMGRHLYEGNAAFRNVLDRVNDLSKKNFDFDLLAHIYGDPDDPAIKKKLGTLVGAQTALFAVELGMARVLEEMGIKPDVMVGHSFGEISAMTFAGVWDLDTAYQVVKARIKAAMQIADGGGPALGMMSVICSEDQRDAILSLVKNKVVLTNINAPGRFVLAGELDAVKQTVAVAESFGTEARLLPIGAAFHSKFMKPAKEPFRQALLKLPCNPPKIPILSTISGEYIDTENVTSESIANHLSAQLTTSLNLPREIGRLYDDGSRHFLEVGPGWSLTKMISAILEGKEYRGAPTLHPKVGDIETFRRARAFLMALGHLDSAAERQNLPGMFAPDFVEYLESSEPAILALISEVHKRYLDAMQSRSVGGAMPRPPAITVSQEVISTPKVEAKKAVEVVQRAPAADASVWRVRVREKLVSITGYPAEMLEDQLDLEADLGVDSVQRAEIWLALTTEHNLDSEARPTGVRTIAQLAESLEALTGPSDGAAAAQPEEETQAQPTPVASDGADDSLIWRDRVREKLVTITGYPEEMLEDQLDLEADLGVDSVQRAEIWLALTTEHNLDTEARPTGVRTIAQLAESLAQLTGPSAPADAPVAKTETTPVETAPAAQGAAPQVNDASVWRERVREKLVSITGYPAEMLEDQLDLEADLGVDSVQRAEIWLALTTEHKLDTDARPTGVRTIAQLAQSLADLTGTPEEVAVSTVAEAPESVSDEIDDSACELFIPTTRGLTQDELKPFKCKNVLCIVEEKDTSLAKMVTKYGAKAVSISTKKLLGMSDKEILAAVNKCDTVIYAAHRGMFDVVEKVPGMRKVLTRQIENIFQVFKALSVSLADNPKRILVPVSQGGSFGSSYEEGDKILGAFPAGFIRSIARELPECAFQLVDAGTNSIDDALGKQLGLLSSFMEVGLTALGRVTPTISRVRGYGSSSLSIGKGDLVLVTGGARGIVFECVLALAKKTGCSLLLTGRTVQPEDDPDWLNAKPEDLDDVIRQVEIGMVRKDGISLGEAKRFGHKAKAQWELNRNLARLRSENIEVRYEVSDVTDAKGFAATIKRVSKTDAITGVVHGAGVQRSKLIGDLDLKAVGLTIDTKVSALLTLIDSLDWSKVKMLIGFGSITGLFGNAGQTDYALANDLMAWMIRGVGARHKGVFAQTVDWTAWVGTGMVTEEEAKRFGQVGLTPLDVETGVGLFLKAATSTEHGKLAALNGSAGFTAGREISDHFAPAIPRKRMLSAAGGNVASFSTTKDLYLDQHLVEMLPVTPGTFVSEIFSESLKDAKTTIADVKFRRPLWVREEGFEVEVVEDGDARMLVPKDRPELRKKGLANLSFATCTVVAAGPGKAAGLDFDDKDIAALKEASEASAPSFYGMLDTKFSHALKTGPIFRGIGATLERDDRFLGAVRLTDEAMWSFEIPGELVFNPVLADMAVQVACAWTMTTHNVMAIPFEIGKLQVDGGSRVRDAVVICRAEKMDAEKTIVDVAIREPDHRLVLSMDKLVLSTISKDES